MNINDVIELNIEKLVYQGCALGRYGENKLAVFVENVLPGEIIKARVVSVNKNYAKAELVDVIKPSSKRIKPFCPIYNACGSCQIQICDYDYLIELKTKILQEIFPDIDMLPVVKSPKTLEYRCKTQYPACQTKNSKRIMLGYYKKQSHNLTNIKFCPVQPDIINKIAQDIRDCFPLDCYCEKTNTGVLRHVLTRFSTNGDILLTLVLNTDKIDNSLFDFSKEMILKYPQIKGVFANFNRSKGNNILGKITQKIAGDNHIIENLSDKQFKIGPTSFFQINPYCANELFKIVKNNVKPNSNILDAYAGVGTIGIYLSDKVNKITYVEENEEAVFLAGENFKLNNIKNYEIFSGDAKHHFLNFKKLNKTFDYVILDPPRSGCDREGLDAISELAQNIIYVSCNPMTLKRDAKLLIEKGFKIKFLQGVDMFPYTYHIECVMIFEKGE